MKETIGDRIARLRTAKGWSRPQLGRAMQPKYSGEAIRRYENDIDRPGPEARRELAKAFGRSEAYIEFGDVAVRRDKAEQPASSYGVSEEAIEIARAFDQMQPQAKEYIREQVFIYTVIDKSFPWLRHGKPMGKSYGEFERWHERNIELKRDLEKQRSKSK